MAWLLPSLVPAIRQAKRECDGSYRPNAAAPATVTGEVVRDATGKPGRQGARQGETPDIRKPGDLPASAAPSGRLSEAAAGVCRRAVMPVRLPVLFPSATTVWPEGPMSDVMELVVCTTCRLPNAAPEDPRAGARLSDALTRAGVGHRRQECLSACTRGCAVVFRGPGRWTYVQGALDPDLHLQDLLMMIRAYAEAPDGVVPWRTRPEVIRKNTIARIPPLED